MKRGSNTDQDFMGQGRGAEQGSAVVNGESDNRPKRRRWLQFSLRAMFVLTLVVALGLGWIANERRKVAMEDQATQAIERLGGYGATNANIPIRLPEPSWQQRLFGESYPWPISHAELPPDTSAEDLQWLQHLRALESVCLRGTHLGDEHVSLLLQHQGLTSIDLSATDITDRGVMQLASLPGLEELHLSHTRITDNSLSYLADCHLHTLDIRDTAVTNATAEAFHRSHAELESFDHERSPSDRHRNAIRKLIQLGAVFPENPFVLEAPSPDAILVALQDGSSRYAESPWHGRPQDLDLLDDIESKLCVRLDATIRTQEYTERLAQLNTTEELRIESMYRPQESLACLAGTTSVESLHVTLMPYGEGTFRSLGDGDLDFLAELPNLNDFSLSIQQGWFFNPELTEVSQAALLSLTRCPRLKHLSLIGVDIRRETLLEILRALDLKTVWVSPTEHLSKEMLREIRKDFPELESE